jgi:hypothetical protein
MSAELWLRPARRRGLADDMLTAAPLALAAVAAAWRWQGIALAVPIALILFALAMAGAIVRARRFDRRWLIRSLDARHGAIEDSAGLLFADDATLGPLQRLQRARIEARLSDDIAATLRPAWSARRIAIAWGVGLVALAAILAWPSSSPEAALAPSAEGGPVVPGVPRLIGQRLRVVPPAYTGLPPRDEPGLDVKAPQGSRLEWTLRFDPQPGSAALAFHDGGRLAVARDGSLWRAARTLDRSLLYRVVPQGGDARRLPLHRLDAIPDLPPRIKVIAPDRSLSLMSPGQRRWPLMFEASDDYGVAPTARLRIVIAQGEGENISFKERSIAVAGIGPATRRRFAPALDLVALGFASGSDLVAQLIVADNRAPGPQVVRSASLILRWPSNLGQEATGIEGVVKKTLPAYFRSQRQIIIDAEALIKAKRGLMADRFVAKSDAIGVDQRILRMRYGQFLGEEAEGGGKAPPTSDAPTSDAPTADAPASNLPVADDHDGGAPPAGPAFGRAENVVAEYGHTHDEPEAATLLDPETRATLKQALDQMWQSELRLRQGQPQQALPFAYKALGFIKQVQQATRIFLARVGPELPPIDANRRMTGKREGIASRTLALAPQPGDDQAPADAWRALDEAPGGHGGALPLDALERWLHAHQDRVPDPLSFVGAIDAVRGDPACLACRRHLRGLLWSALVRPPAGVARRAAPDAAGRRYLDALGYGR